MGLIRFAQAHNRNKVLKEMRKLKEQEPATLEQKELNDTKKESEIDAKEIIKIRYGKGEITKEEYEEMKKDFESW